MTRVQADIVPSVKDWLTAQSLGAQVRTNVDANWKPADGPLLIVADDGGPVVMPIKSRHTLRLTAYAAGRTEARRIATLAAGKLIESRPRPTGVAHISSYPGAVLDAKDKGTGAVLASVLVIAHAKTVEI